MLTERGLEPALAGLAARAPVPVHGPPRRSTARLPPELETAAYFMVSEALTNVAKYAGATEAEVSLRVSGGEVVLEVRDDGIGGADARQRAAGCSGIADRVAALDGALEVDSPVGGGTVLRARVPYRVGCPSRLRPPHASTLSGPSGAFSCTGAGKSRGALRVLRDDVQHRYARVARDGVGEVGADPLRALARQRRDDHLVVAHRVPDLAERLERDRVADDAVAAARSRPRATPPARASRRSLARRAVGAARVRGGHHQRRVDRAALAPVDERLDELRRRGGAVGEHDHVSGHGQLPSGSELLCC